MRKNIYVLYCEGKDKLCKARKKVDIRLKDLKMMVSLIK